MTRVMLNRRMQAVRQRGRQEARIREERVGSLLPEPVPRDDGHPASSEHAEREGEPPASE